MITDFWTAFGRLADVLGIGALFFSGYAAFRLWRENRQLREIARKGATVENFTDMVKLHDGVKSTAPVALVLSFSQTSDSIKPSVDVFLAHKSWRMPVEEFNMNGINGAADLEGLIVGLREKRRFLEAAGYTEVHLFYQGPVMAAALLGSVFDNWIPVKLYHKPTPAPPQIYEYWMPLL